MTNSFPACPICSVRCIPYGTMRHHHGCYWQGEYEVRKNEKTNRWEYIKKETAKAVTTQTAGFELNKKGDLPAADIPSKERTATINEIISTADIPELESIIDAAQEELANLGKEKTAKNFEAEEEGE